MKAGIQSLKPRTKKWELGLAFFELRCFCLPIRSIYFFARRAVRGLTFYLAVPSFALLRSGT